MSRSPQVTLRERDQSSFPNTTSDTITAIVGFGTKGPIGKAVQLSGRNAFVNTFGSIPEKAPWGHLAAYKAFRQGQIIYYRIATDDATEAVRVIRDDSPEAAGYQEFLRTSIIDFGSYEPEALYVFDLAIDGGVVATITITAPYSGDWELENVATLINAELTGATASIVDERIRITSDDAATGTIEITTVTSPDPGEEDLVALLGGTDTAVGPSAASDPEQEVYVVFQAREKGTDGNKISVSKTTNYDPIEARYISNISIWFDGEERETFEDVSFDINSDNFFARLINREPENDGSSLVTVDQYSDVAGDATFDDGVYNLGTSSNEDEVEYEEGTTVDIWSYDYKPGNDGVPVSGGAGLYVNAFGQGGDLANSEKFNYHILATPDNGSQTVQNAAISLAESRKDFFYISDAPLGLTYTEVAEWHNGQGYGRTAALNSSFTGVYWPWLKDLNPANDEYIWCPPSVFLAEKLMEVDNNYAPWYAPAGDLRGRVVANDTEFSPNLNQRDFIYGRPNAVNPIVNFSTKGIIVYGQKTALRSRSALDRVNVRRMVIYASKLIKDSMEGLIFEPHVPESWARATDFINRILEPIRQDNGLEDYQVVIDATTNDQDAIANNTMKGIIRLVPVNAIEVIDLTITFLSPGVAIT